MSEINEQEIADLRMQIDQYRTELEEKTESYLNLKEKYETMKILELDLRHEIYELKKELHDSHIEQENHGKGQGQYNHLKYITTLLEDMHKLLDKSISQPYDQLNLDKQHSKMIHRPAKENNKAIGLGKESMLRMKDNHEKNGPRHEENEQKNSLNENNQEMTKEVTEKNMQKLMQSEQVNRENKNNNEPVKSEVKSFKELKKLVNNLKDQENSSAQQQNQTVTDHPSETKQDHIQKKESVNQSKDFTFRDLQQAQHIYSKPLSRMNTTTTTSINRQIQKKEIRKDQSSNKPVFIEKTTSNEIDTQQNKPPKSDRTQVDENNKTQHPKEPVAEESENVTKRSEVQENDNDQQLTMENNQGQENQSEINPVPETKEINQQKNKQEAQKSQLQNKKTNESSTPTQTTQSIIESENNQEISTEFEYRESDDTQLKPTGNESFFKSLLKKFR